MTFQLSVPCYNTTPRKQYGGHNFALCPAIRNRKSLLGEDPDVKAQPFPLHCIDSKSNCLSLRCECEGVRGSGGMVVIDDWCISLCVQDILILFATIKLGPAYVGSCQGIDETYAI